MAQVAGKQGVLIIEGIHALNPHYTAKIADSEKFRIYISPITSLQVSATKYRQAGKVSRKGKQERTRPRR